jgi:hypothetical protein
MNKHSSGLYERIFFGVVLCFMYGGILYASIMFNLPTANQRILDVLTGSLTTSFVGLYYYYYGSSAGSAKKTDALITQAKAPKQVNVQGDASVNVANENVDNTDPIKEDNTNE